jgi:glycosyltransferase involved in cell wall biosynthesis
MKIAFFSGDITRSGGTERVAITIAQELSKKEEHQISFVSLAEASDQPFFPLDNSIERAVLSKKWINPGPGYLSVIIRLIKYIKKHRIDIIIDIDGVLDVLSLPAKLFTRVRVVSWEQFNFYQDLGCNYRRWIRRLSARYADCIVTLTDTDRRFYQENLQIHNEIRVIHNPIGYMDETPIATRVPGNKFRILSVGNLIPQKGFDYIPEIGLILSKNHPDLEWEWYVAGEGPERTSLQSKINLLGLENRIFLKGLIQDMAGPYSEADIFVLTSRFEGLPMVLLEAKMFRLPIISFDIHTGPREIIEHERNGYLLSPPMGDGLKEFAAMADHIALLCTDKVLYHQFAEHSLDHMETFQPDYVTDRWNNLLMHLANTPS